MIHSLCAYAKLPQPSGEPFRCPGRKILASSSSADLALTIAYLVVMNVSTLSYGKARQRDLFVEPPAAERTYVKSCVAPLKKCLE